VILAVLVLGLVTVAACWQARRRPYLAVGWFWFCGTLLPVIGLVQVGLQARADRYSYLPFIGLFVALTWGVSDLAAGWRHRRAVLGGGAAVVIVACMTLTFHQVRLWKNTEILFQHALAVTTDNALAHQNLGAALAGQGKFEAAWPHFVEALRIWPDYPEAQSNLGYLLVEKGHWADAVRLFRAALKLRPRMAQTHYLLGRALSALGNRPESIAEFKTTLQLNPTHTLAMENLAWLLATDPDPLGGAGPEALRLAQQACRATASRDSQMLATLAAALARTGQFEEAARRMEQAIALPAAAGKPSLEAKYEQMLATFRAGKAWREDPPGTQP
jgi:tetratricopeptide (TPR) repeat protein